jgi:hypothetical protein
MVFLYENKTRWFGLEGVEVMPLSELCVIDFSASEPRSSCLEEVGLSCDEHEAGVLGMRLKQTERKEHAGQARLKILRWTLSAGA